MTALDRFIKYVKIDTQADDTTGTTPSTQKQKDLGKVLVDDLKELGVQDAYMDEYGIVYGHIPGEGNETIGLNAHIDTALEVTDSNVNPQIIKNYDGNDIVLSKDYTLKTSQFPSIKKHIGKDLVVTDGSTLLGADDKAGIAIIMGAVSYLKDHPEIKHHPIAISFTVDEEIGEGPDHFDLNKMKADYCFTIDGGDIDEIAIENFNAQSVKLDVEGVAVHPGEGKDKLINAMLIINDFINMLPKNDTPYEAGKDDGYWHINSINGTSAEAHLDMILRDFNRELLSFRDNCIKDAVNKLQQKYPTANISYSISEQYENMFEYVKKDMRAVIKAEAALRKNGLEPKRDKIRGGTDGATFSKMGLVTPNLGTGSANHHGRYEYLVIQDFYKMIDVVIDILKI